MKHAKRKAMLKASALEAAKVSRINDPLFVFVAERYYSDPEDRQQPVGGRGHTHIAKDKETVKVMQSKGTHHFPVSVEREVKAVATYQPSTEDKQYSIPEKWNATNTRKGKVK